MDMHTGELRGLAGSRKYRVGGGLLVNRFVLIVVAGLFIAWSSTFLDAYTASVLTVCYIFAIAALSVDLLWGYTGILSYAQGAFFGIGAYSFAIVTSRDIGGSYSAIVGVVAAVVVAGMAAWILGGVSFHSRSTWIYVAVVTFAAPYVFERLILAGGEFTGASSGIAGFMPVLSLSIQQWYLISGGMLLLALFVCSVIVGSDAGKVLRAIRDNETRCRYLGINVTRIKLLLFGGAGGLAAIAGVMYAATQNVVASDLGGFHLATMMVIWTAVGGRGTLLGPVVAAISINWFTASVGAEYPYFWQLSLGVIFVLVVLFLPRGAAGLAKSAWAFVEGRLGRERGGSQMVLIEVDYRTEWPESEWDLSLDSVSLDYGSLRAVSGVTLKARAGELIGIVGPNGAGKSSLMRCISDGVQRTSGHIEVLGRSIGRKGPSSVAGMGVSQKFQHASVFAAMTVAECLRVACYQRERPSFLRVGRELSIPAPAMDVIRATGLDQRLSAVAGELSHGQKQALELAMVMCTEPRVVLLDEPTAGLSVEERSRLGEIFTQIRVLHGVLILLVEHDLDFVREISTRMVVLHQGELLLDGTVDEVVESEVVQQIYTGTLEVQS